MVDVLGWLASCVDGDSRRLLELYELDVGISINGVVAVGSVVTAVVTSTVLYIGPAVVLDEDTTTEVVVLNLSVDEDCILK